MRHPLHTRRTFLHQTALAAAGATCLAAAPAFAAKDRRLPVRLGGPLYNAPADPEAQARACRALGYRAVYCPGIPLAETDRIKAFADAFAKHDVAIAEVGRWVNLLDADPEKRRANLQNVTEGLALAEAIGARCCVDIAGSFSTREWYGPHPKNLSREFFDAAVENARKIIDGVKPRRTSFCYEMMGWALPDSADGYLRLLRAVDRKAFGVHLDPCNLVNCPERFYDNTRLLNECFDKLGKHIVSCHAKDLDWNVEMNLHFREVVPGKGSLDYATYLRRLAELPQNPPLMLEHLANEKDYTAGREHIVAVGKAAGVSFE
jgi:sugar phosphate isomerase/epimerase